MAAAAAPTAVLPPVQHSRRPTSLQSRRHTVRGSPADESIQRWGITRNGALPTAVGSRHRDGIRFAAATVSEDKLTRPKTVPELVEFLYGDLPHLFDAQGIDRTAYDERVQFRDPITRHDGIAGYLFNISLLRALFTPEFYLHSVKPTGPLEITTRWTMVMRFALLPWKPQLVFTGRSIMGINPDNMKFNSHVDVWDSLENNDYFSVEGVLDMVKQMRYYKTPDLDTPKYSILRRTANYEVRQYQPFLVAETASGSELSGSSGFNRVTGYIFGKNTEAQKIPMTTPVFTQAVPTTTGGTGEEASGSVSIQVVLPSDRELGALPDPTVEGVRLKEVQGGYAAAVRFSGKPTEEVVRGKEKELRDALVRHGLRPRNGCVLARYNDPGRTPTYIMRNEVLIWLDGFTLDDRR